MAVIRAQKVPKKILSPEDTLAKFCYYFPQYTYENARKLPYKRIVKMLEVAAKEQASVFHQLTQIVAAPHTKRGSGVNKLLKHYERVIRG
jgi:hypothetical protein